MADTSAQTAAERWIVQRRLPKVLGQPFTKRGVKLRWGGTFEFDGVSEDGRTVVCISTSCCRTSTGRMAIGKFHKIKADALYLLGARGVSRRVLVFTDRAMLAHFQRERERGRFPADAEIELHHVELPKALTMTLNAARILASGEVTPAAAGALIKSGSAGG